jgi:hypothetical protein
LALVGHFARDGITLTQVVTATTSYNSYNGSEKGHAKKILNGIRIDHRTGGSSKLAKILAVIQKRLGQRNSCEKT